MSSNEKISNVLGDMKEDVVMTPLSEKEYSTKDVEKGTDILADVLLIEKKYSTRDLEKVTGELADMKQTVNIILKEGLDQFKGQSSGSKGRFKLDIGFFRQLFLKVINISIKNCLKRIFNIKACKCIKRLLYCLIYS